MLNIKFIAMKKSILLLTIISLVWQSLIVNAQTNNTDSAKSMELKKGDWFIIEFANRLEDYSQAKDSVDYSAPIDLRQLVLRGELIEKTENFIGINFDFERIFHISKKGEYADSYFQNSEIVKQGSFKIGIEVDLKNDSIIYKMPEDDDRLSYSLFIREVNIKESSSTQSNSQTQILFVSVKELINRFLVDWRARNFKLPVSGTGNLDVAGFKKYRLLKSSFPIRSNFLLNVVCDTPLEIDSFEIFEGRNFEFPLYTKEKLVSGKVKEGAIELPLYLDEQKLLGFKAGNYGAKFIATPGDSVFLTLAENPEDVQVKSKKIGDQLYSKSLADPQNRFVIYPGKLRQTNSVDSALWGVQVELEKKINLLDGYKNNMSANWYRKQLKEIEYWAADCIVHWFQKQKLNTDYSILSKVGAFENIQPLFDYHLNIEQYDSYIGTVTNNTIYQPIESLSNNHGFSRMFNSNDNYNLCDKLYWGYPKYYALKRMVEQDLQMGGYVAAQMNYDKFLSACKYPRFVKEIKSTYDDVGKMESGKPVFNLDLNFLKSKSFNRSSKSFKIVYFVLSDFKEQLKKLFENFSKQNISEKPDVDYELYIVCDKRHSRDILEVLPLDAGIEISVLELESSEYIFKDLSTLGCWFYKTLILSPDNKIVSRVGSGRGVLHRINNYIESQNQPKSYKNRIAVILGALSTLLLLILTTWLAVRITTKQVAKKEAARRKVSELELKAIRSQMNPHFIFNAMGSIQNLINQNNSKNANLYLASFARLMRMVLSNSNKKLISLSEEIELLKHYLELEQLRVNFQFNINLSENIEPETEEIPGMLIQPFVENAVIHGITPKGEGNIKVDFSKSENTLICKIVDDGVGIDTSEAGNGNGVAMKLSEKRLNLLNSQLRTKLSLKVENRMETEKTGGTKITLLIPVG